MKFNSAEEAAARASLLQHILDALPTPIFAKDDQARFVFSNRNHCELVGKSSDELLGNTDADIYPSQSAKRFLATDLGVIATGVTSLKEEIVSQDGGVAVPVLSRKVRMTHDDGKTYLVGINYSLAEVKKREEQYRALAETVPVGVVQIEEDGSLSFFNPLLHAYLGGDDATTDLAHLCRALDNPKDFPGVATRFETTLTPTAQAQRRVLVISSGWLRLGRNDKRSAIVSLVDVSENAELKRINEEILRLNRELASSMQMLRDAQDALVKKGRMEQMGQLTATIAHELRNPLGAVRTSAYLVERKIKDKGLGVEQQLQRINNGVTRCDAIITQLLDFSRTKKLDCKSEDMDAWLGKLVEDEAKRLAACINVTCYLGLDGFQVPFDPGRLQRAVTNLVGNASEAMVGNGHVPLPTQTRVPEIKIISRIVGQFAEIEVADNGPGIPDELLAKIRDPLFTTKSFGTGLGIPAVEQIAAQHGGSLDIQTELGVGTRFVLRLPLVATDEEKVA